MTATNLAAQIRAALSEEVAHEESCPKDDNADNTCHCARAMAFAALRAVMELHPHKHYDSHGKTTFDVSKSRSSRCETCGNVFGAAWCLTVRAVARELHVAGTGA